MRVTKKMNVVGEMNLKVIMKVNDDDSKKEIEI